MNAGNSLQDSQELQEPLRILITALGGEGGGTLMNWLVAAARENGFAVQATSVPGVAQRTGATSYYVEVARGDQLPVLNLLPMPGRIDLVLCSELVEAARVIEAGYVSPERTTLVASNSRTYAIAEKVRMADGRYDTEAIVEAATEMSKQCHLLDLQQLAEDNNTFISATLFGAVAACGVLPWDTTSSRRILESTNRATSVAGFNAAADSIANSAASRIPEPDTKTNGSGIGPNNEVHETETPEGLQNYACGVLEDYQDADYAGLYRERLAKLQPFADAQGKAGHDVMMEASRRLANWMAYEDIARVADLKTRPERYRQVREECAATPEQIVRITEYLKPRAEEIADMLPLPLARKIMRRVEQGKSIPFLGKGRRIPSNAAWGYWLLRMTASMKRYRRRSLRFETEQRDIEHWLELLAQALPQSAEFALSLAELPRVRKGYSDTLLRGLESYQTIMGSIVKPAIESGQVESAAGALREALDAAFADEDHDELNETVVKFYPKLSGVAGIGAVSADA